MKYYLTGAVASACFLMGTVLLYGASGSLDVTTVGRQVLAHPDPIAFAGAALLVAGFLYKISGVPICEKGKLVGINNDGA